MNISQSRSGGRKMATCCRACRIRHLKCDNNSPSCAGCAKLGLTCVRQRSARFKYLTSDGNSLVAGHKSSNAEFIFPRDQQWTATVGNLQFLDETRDLLNIYDHEPERHGSDVPTRGNITEHDSPTNLKSPSVVQTSPTANTANRSFMSDCDNDLTHPSPVLSTDFQDIHTPRIIDTRPSIVPERSSASPNDAIGYLSWTSSVGERNRAPPRQVATSEATNSPSLSNPYTPATHLQENGPLDFGQPERDSPYVGVKSANVAKNPTGFGSLNNEEEAKLLRYYVEHLARRFDLTDPERHFRTVVPQRALICPPLLNAIFALAARHLSRTGEFDPLVSNRYHQQCLELLIPILNDSNVVLDENLLASMIILRHLEEIEIPLSTQSQLNESEKHLLGARLFMAAQGNEKQANTLSQAAFWVGLRQEIYVSCAYQRPLPPPLSHLDRSFTPTSDHGWSCRMVVLCADVIQHCFGDENESSSAYVNLSNLIAQWDERKPDSFLPVYCREAMYPRAFPSLWFLREEISIGWQHFHIAKILLAAHDPKIPRIGPRRAAAIRQMDDEIRHHVRQLCGICESNPDVSPNYTYAAMAVTIAGEKFDQRYEQEALLKILTLGDKEHAYPVGPLEQSLKTSWGWR